MRVTALSHPSLSGLPQRTLRNNNELNVYLLHHASLHTTFLC